MSSEDFLDAVNADVLAELIADPDTPDNQRVKMIKKLMESRKSENFFATMLVEMLSHGECPHCGHTNHWLIPEDELNQMGYVSHKEDERVKHATTIEDCPKWQESCAKKKITV